MSSAPTQMWRSAQRVLRDPRVMGVAQALPRTAAVLGRTRAGGADMPAFPVTAGLAAQVMLDEILISVMRDPKLFPHGTDYETAAADIAAAYRLWSEQGWLASPESYHEDPPAPARVAISRQRALDQRFEHITFDSGYEPHPGEPGRERWLAQELNRTAHAYVLRHGEPGRPWLVCLHGFGMGQATMDLRGFRAGRLHYEHGLNLAMVVLPVHGPRQAPGKHRGEGFMSIDLIDSVHGLAQAAWDTRRVIRWIRSVHGDAPVGVSGISLGGYVSALVASLEPSLTMAIAGIPVTDLPDLYMRHSTPHVRRRALATGALGPEANAVHSVVSPLKLSPKVPKEGRFIFAGVGDRMSTAGHARRLWEHWDRPRIEWYPGGHIGFFLAGGVSRFIDEALASSGLISPVSEPVALPPAPAPSEPPWPAAPASA